MRNFKENEGTHGMNSDAVGSNEKGFVGRKLVESSKSMVSAQQSE